MPDDKPYTLLNYELRKCHLCNPSRGVQEGPALTGSRWATAACDPRYEKKALVTVSWELVRMGEGQDRRKKPEVLTQPMHQGFVYHNSLISSCGTEDVKKMENMFLFHILGERQGSHGVTTLLTQEKMQQKGRRGQATRRRLHAMC